MKTESIRLRRARLKLQKAEVRATLSAHLFAQLALVDQRPESADRDQAELLADLDAVDVQLARLKVEEVETHEPPAGAGGA